MIKFFSIVLVVLFFLHNSVAQSNFSVVYPLTANTSATTTGPVTASAFSSVGVANAGFESCNGKTGYRTNGWCNDIWFGCDGAGDHADYYTFSITVNPGYSISISYIEFEVEGTVSNCNWHENYYETWFSKGAFDYYNNSDCGTTARNAYTNSAGSCAIPNDCAYCPYSTGGAGWTKQIYKAPDNFNAMTVNSGETVTFRIHMDENSASSGTNRNFIRAVGVSGPFPLPIKILGFNGNVSGETVHLSWSTTTEINNDYFTIERSIDAEQWNISGTIKGAGSSNTIQEYRFTDSPDIAPGIQTIYYRLKQTDFDGNYEYFGPIAVSLSANSSWDFTLHSAVSDENLFGNLSVDEEKNIQMTILDMNGRVLKQESFYANEGANFVLTDVHQLNKGMYFLRISDNKNTTNCKFIKR